MTWEPLHGLFVVYDVGRQELQRHLTLEGGCDLKTDDVITFATADVRISLRPPANS